MQTAWLTAYFEIRLTVAAVIVYDVFVRYIHCLAMLLRQKRIILREKKEAIV